MNISKVDYLDGARLKEGIYNIGNFNFEVIKTPGHSDDSICFYFKNEKIMFVGDFIFKGSIGRCDLPTGNYDEMKESIKKIMDYDNDIILYPGHGDVTSLGDEKRNNPYFK